MLHTSTEIKKTKTPYVFLSYLSFLLSCISHPPTIFCRNILSSFEWTGATLIVRNSRRALQSRVSAQRSFGVGKWQGILHLEEILIYTIPAWCWTWNWQLQLWKEPSDSPWQFSETIAAGCSDGQKKPIKYWAYQDRQENKAAGVILPLYKALVHPQLEGWDFSGLPVSGRTQKSLQRNRERRAMRRNQGWAICLARRGQKAGTCQFVEETPEVGYGHGLQNHEGGR